MMSTLQLAPPVITVISNCDLGLVLAVGPSAPTPDSVGGVRLQWDGIADHYPQAGLTLGLMSSLPCG